jgi:Superinfection immunity protein
MHPEVFRLGFAAICLALSLVGIPFGPIAHPPVQTATSTGDENTVAAIVTVLVILAVYFLPAILANRRSHRNETGIFVLNLRLGWTLIGWVVAIVWAFTRAGPARPTTDDPGLSQAGRLPCPYCVGAILPTAPVCHFCRRELAAAWAEGFDVVTLRRYDDQHARHA